MGDWTLFVSGHGIHDNGKSEDADMILREMVGKLRAAGHDVHCAWFCSGLSYDVWPAGGSKRTPSTRVPKVAP